MQIINFFYELARQHKRVKGFIYDKTMDKGAGNDVYPLVWVDDPITGSFIGNGVLQYALNVDFLGIPATDADVAEVQAEAFLVGLGFIERITEIRAFTGFSVDRYSFVSLRDYYDDNAAGFRFTIGVIQANPINRCAEDFDPDKTIGHPDALPDFKSDNPNGCATFSNAVGLPNFKI